MGKITEILDVFESFFKDLIGRINSYIVVIFTEEKPVGSSRDASGF